MGRAAAVLAVLLLAAPGARAQPAADPSEAIEIAGAAYAEFDERSGLLTLRGAPVVIRRGAMRLRAPMVVYDARGRIVRASGGVQYADARVSLEAPRVTAWLAEERLLASGGVRGAQEAEGEPIRVQAARLEVFGRDGRLVAVGAVEIVAQEAAVTADRVEAVRGGAELLAEGNARVLRGDIEGRAPRVTVRRDEGTAVLSGGAVVRRGPSEARAETITVDLRAYRFTAAGGAVLLIHPSR